MTRNPLAPVLLTASLLLGLGRAGAAQSRFDSAVATSWDVAHDLEHLRTPPESINFAGESISPSGWFEIGVRAILNIAAIDTRSGAEATWVMPTVLYPEIILEDAAYGSVLDRSAYLDFLENLADSYPSGAVLPSTFVRNGAEFRFVDALLMVARLLRFYDAFGYLPDFVDPKIATPRGLFPWDIPAGMETHLSAIQNENGGPYAATNEYYLTSVLDFGLYALAHDVVGALADPFEAGRRIYDWSYDRYNQSPYGVNYDVTNLTGFVDDSWEMIRNMQGTSGKPARMNSGLYVAAGLVHGFDSRGYAGTLYSESDGWYNAEIHARYGGGLTENSFFRFDGDPVGQYPSTIPVEPQSAVIREVNLATKLDTEAPLFRAFWVNPADVETWGAGAIVEAAIAGGFSAVILKVKSFVGRLYFMTGASGGTRGDALEPLVEAARDSDVAVYAAFNTLGDFETGRAEEWGQRYLEPVFGAEYNEFFMSPCVPDYVAYLKQLVTDLYERYDIEGLVLARNYVHSDGWANPECGIDGRSTDRVKRGRIGSFANDLAGHAKSLDSDRRILYMTAPLLSSMGDALDVYSHDAEPNDLTPDNFNGIILTIQGLAWLTPENVGFSDPPREARDAMLAEYLDRSLLPVYTMIHLSKDWMYAPAFYRGLSRSYASRGLSGVILTAPNSPEGEFGPAFVEQHRAKLSRIRFEAPPPAREVITRTGAEHPIAGDFVIGSPFPNPSRDVVRLELVAPSSGHIDIRVADLLGRTVEIFHRQQVAAGRHEFEWRPTGLSPGVYFLDVEGPWGAESRKMVIQ